MVAAVSAPGDAAGLQHIVVMGVSGCGKSTVGAGLGAELGWPFEEGDRYHLPASIAKMSAGIPLEDADRWPWLEKLAELIAAHQAEGRSSILACSALKRAYRDVLRTGAPRVRFLHLHGAQEVLQARLDARKGHFFPPGLLASQYATLEPLAPDEDGIVVDVALAPEEQVAEGLRRLGLRTEGG
jgi:carbohydrate kinase (thermoresistant glucokinase family)